jgi:DNA repair ATPase RecN
MGQKEKSKFRQSAKWKKFRNYMKKKNKKDFITNYPLRKSWNLHHLDLNEEHYENLTNEENFMCLNKMTHETVHNLFRYYSKDKDVLKRLETVLNKMDKLNNSENIGGEYESKN